ncbi:MAG: oligosaccharyl transferase, archaeosortase A system-associated [Chloroflexota bacterium]|nr:MAG: oligosaccharyl transferase, archaeosortase A system-associated [Chloroflexota bacterium]
MNTRVFSEKIIAGILVALFFGIALYIRVVLPYDQVFVGDWIKFTGVDAYFFMRQVDSIVHNFPHLMTFDPYALYPDGSYVGIRSFFVYMIAGVAWFVGLGSPTQHVVDVVGVYFPAVLGALMVIPVFFIGKALFNRWAGVIAAGLVGILPGEFLGRSILGFTDYHVAEVLFTTITMMFLILAVKNAKEKELTFEQVKDLNWAAMAKPFVYSFLAGIFLGIYLLTWAGALLFVFIIFVYLIIQFIIDHLKNRSTDYLCFVSIVVFIIASLMFLPTSPNRMFLASLIISIVIPVVLAVLSRFMSSRDIKPVIYPVALVGLGLVSLVIFRIASPSLFQSMISRLYIFTWPTETTVYEMRPLLLPAGGFSWDVAWGNFTTGFFLSFIALGILVYSVIKQGDTDKTLFVVWSLVILAATLSMRRFAYYFVVNVALLTGYISWLVLKFSGFGRPATEYSEPLEVTKKKKKWQRKQQSVSAPAANRVYMVLGVIFIFLLVFYPNIGPLPRGEGKYTKYTIDTASAAPFAPSDAWCESLSWLRDNSSEPFDNSEFYYEFYQPPSRSESYDYPQTAYGVTAWWDYGYWITRISRRIPTSNPGTGDEGEALLFTAQNEDSANEILEDKWGSKYIIVDYLMTYGKFHAVATLSGSTPGNFYDDYYLPQDGSFRRLFYPEYYRSLVVRLYNFGGKQVVPNKSIVISYEQKITLKGQSYREITSVKDDFPSYEEAEAYISSQKSGNYKIVSPDPFTSPVPLEALEHYKLVYSSKGTVLHEMIPQVKIFEYIK